MKQDRPVPAMDLVLERHGRMKGGEYMGDAGTILTAPGTIIGTLAGALAEK